jgi:ubiquinol-cytochrome c reductase cytochrome c1 subunit
VPRPPKPEAKPTEAKLATEGEAAPTTVEPEGETPILTEAEIPASEPEPAVEPEPAAEATAETPAPAEPAADVPASEPAADASADEPSAEDIPSPS